MWFCLCEISDCLEKLLQNSYRSIVDSRIYRRLLKQSLIKHIMFTEVNCETSSDFAKFLKFYLQRKYERLHLLRCLAISFTPSLRKARSSKSNQERHSLQKESHEKYKSVIIKPLSQNQALKKLHGIEEI